ncbi:putative maltase-glucoamylase 2 [Hypsibius exemplaris]|uniref:Maltase-glucoamylase 2 n=1 Tax=Hypsibius exemplaris TaxID=2072580 RepID=A0A9X6NC00_HYPEX|nr:putative maltase-glucoamylase 2 [Hypsibius exemplaris]
MNLFLGLVCMLIFGAAFAENVEPSNGTDNLLIPETDRVDCSPQGEIGEPECRRLGCVHRIPSTTGTPACYLTPARHRYAYAGPSVKASSTAWSTVNENKLEIPLTLLKTSYSVTGEAAVKELTVEFERYSTRVMAFRIQDADHKRYEVPSSVVKLAIPRRLNKHFYRVEYVSDPGLPFAFKIIRQSTNTTLIDTTLGGMVFEENFVQFVTKLASSNVYGFGDNRHGSFRHKMDWTSTPIFSRKTDPTVREHPRNHAGAHPFVMVVENDGNAHGIFLLNSNAMEYKLQPSPALTLRSLGGVLEFLVCFGVTPNDVIIEYTQTIGRPEIPPYWSLGLHESTLARDAEQTLDAHRKAAIPLDVLHVRSQEHDGEWDVTVMRYALAKAIKSLHLAGGHAMVSLKPYIRVDADDEIVRSVYQDGLWKDIFVKWPAVYGNSTDIVPDTLGPSSTLFGYDSSKRLVAFVDFFQPIAGEWWEAWLNQLRKQIPWDGFVLEDNEPAALTSKSETTVGLVCPKNSTLESPKYSPSAVDVWNSKEATNLLSDETICMVALHKIENATYRHYDVHNIYGHSQAVSTKNAIWKLTGKRGFLISDSSFAGTGTVAGAWFKTSLKESVPTAIRQSIISALEFNLFGMTAAGGSAEVFPVNASDCIKWQVFTTFHILAKSVVTSCSMDSNTASFAPVRKAIDTRFLLLPYLYTLFFHGLMEGEAIYRPLFFEYGTKLHNRNVLDIDDQFFWGSGVMFAPSLENNPTRSVYFPHDTFYQIDSGMKIVGDTRRKPVDMPENQMAVFLRAGYIIPTQPRLGAMSTSAARRNPFSLLIALHEHSDGSAVANGNLFWDDGESLDTVEKRDYMSWVIFNKWQEGNFSRSLLDYDVERNLIKNLTDNLTFGSLVVYGFDCSESPGITLRLDGRPLTMDRDNYSLHFEQEHKLLTIKLTVPFSQSFKLEIIAPVTRA